MSDFMSVSERAAYLKGLAEGLDLDKSKPEGKLIDAMLDLIYDMSDEISCIEEDVQFLVEQNDELFEIIDEIGYEADDDYDYFDEDNPEYEVKCPDCGAEIVVDEDTLIEGEMSCPNCGGELEFDFSSLFADEFDDELKNYCDEDCESCNLDDCDLKDKKNK